MLFNITEDHEKNCNRRNNLRICGIPESVSTTNPLLMLKRLFNGLLGAEEGAAIEIDRAHRMLGPRSQDPRRSRDILGCIHYFTIKELILHKASEWDILLDGYKVQLLFKFYLKHLDKR